MEQFRSQEIVSRDEKIRILSLSLRKLVINAKCVCLKYIFPKLSDELLFSTFQRLILVYFIKIHNKVSNSKH